MHKSELIRSLATATKTSKSHVESVNDAPTDMITKTLKKGDTVNFIGFDKFKTSNRSAPRGHNPTTGTTLKIPARTVARFTPGSKLAKTVR